MFMYRIFIPFYILIYLKTEAVYPFESQGGKSGFHVCRIS